MTKPISRIHRRGWNWFDKLMGTKKEESYPQLVSEWNYDIHDWDYKYVDSKSLDKWAEKAGYGKYNKDKPRKFDVIWDDQGPTSKQTKAPEAKVCYYGKRC